jgi:hypothetical protein
VSCRLQVPEWQELAVDRRKWRNVLKSTDIVWCCRYKELDCLRRDTALTNRGPRQKDRGTRVTACTTSRPKPAQGGGGVEGGGGSARPVGGGGV